MDADTCTDNNATESINNVEESTEEEVITSTNIGESLPTLSFLDDFSIYNLMTVSNIWFMVAMVAAFFAACGLGYLMIELLRNSAKKFSKKVHTLALIPLVTPVSLYWTMYCASSLGFVNVVIADAFSFGFLMGTVYTLSLRPKGKYTIKLRVQQLKNPDGVRDVWLESPSVVVGEVRRVIAEELDVNPVTRLAIESGKGRFLEDLQAPFLPLISSSGDGPAVGAAECNNQKRKDFFGFSVYSCYVEVREYDPARDDVAGDRDDPFSNRGGTIVRKRSHSNFMSLLNTKGEGKFGVELVIMAKVPTASGSAAPFYINPIDAFAAAAPVQPVRTMRIVKWATETCDKDTDWELHNSSSKEGDEGDEDGSTAPYPHPSTMTGSINGKRLSPPLSPIMSGVKGGLGGATPGSATSTASASDAKSKKAAAGATANLNLKASGQPIRHGDVVVIECEGKYMAVARGWWMKWGSPVARRSGAFVVEMIEKAPQNKLKEQIKEGFESLRETFDKVSVQMGVSSAGGGAHGGTPTHSGGHRSGHGGTADTSTPSYTVSTAAAEIGDPIRTGDAFRLRSVKFPEYELGITNVKIRDDYCYLGLRKIGDTTSAGSDEWCQEVWFYIRLNSLSTEMFKMT